MKLGLLGKTARSPVFLGVILFVFSVLLPPFDDVTEVDLTLHMLQHLLIVVSGALISYPIYSRGGLRILRTPWAARLAFLAVVATFAFWHLPVPWDSAVLNPVVHATEHFSFLFAGLLIGSALMGLSDSGKIAALVLAFFGHMAYAVVLISPSGGRVYPIYSFSQQSTLGWVLILTGPSFLVGVAYLVAKNPNWLQGSGFRKTTNRDGRPPAEPWVPRGLTVPILTLLMIATLTGYFAFTAVAISAGGGQAGQHSAVVYITETPLSWQYSPQNLRVVLGVNNTVTWVSHSISYDTVTGDNGTVSSGPIAPGQSFTFTFSQVGEFGYHCVYHPWMVGSVTVLPSPG